MTGYAVVAIPEQSDPAWKLSSEKIPHMTLLYLGKEKILDLDLTKMLGYVEHAAKTTLFPFYMVTDHRGLLGSDDADVLFFEKDKHGKAAINTFRNYLLTDPVIRAAYDNVEQYPVWTPHLTLGYLKTPAKKDVEGDKPWGVHFDRIAFWTDDYTGPEFKLEPRDFEESDMAMSDVDKFLEHFGVKGMQWGRRKDAPADGVTVVTQKRPGTKLQAEGGKKIEAHQDAISAATSKQKAKRSTTDALSNKELQELVNRMNLEQQYSRLAAGNVSPGKKFVNELLVGAVKQNASKIINEQINNKVNAAK